MSRKIAQGTKVLLLRGLQEWLKYRVESTLDEALNIIEQEDGDIEFLHEGSYYEATKDWINDLEKKVIDGKL